MENLGITGNYINSVLFKSSHFFVGVDNFSIELHKLSRFSTINYEDEHFVAILAFPTIIYFIDPLGLPPTSSKIMAFLMADERPTKINSTTYQHPLSVYCGFFCIYFVLYFENRPTRKIRKFNLDNLTSNDAICISNIMTLLENKNSKT